MDRSLILLLLLCLFLSASAQTFRINLSGVVRDSSTLRPLSDANIAIRGIPFTGTSSDQEGKFILEIDSFPVVLIISRIGYKTQTLRIIDDQALEILLASSTVNLSEITVRAKPKIDTVFNEPYNVVDYLLAEDFLVILIYRNITEKYELVIIDESERVVDRLSMTKERPVSLFKSCLDNLYLNTKYRIYRINLIQGHIALGPQISEQRFDNVIKPCLLAQDSLLFYQRYFYQGQAIHFYSLISTVDKTDSLTFFPMIEDDQQIIRLIEAAGYRLPWSGDFWDTGITGGLKTLRESPYRLKGEMRMFFPKLYIPLYKIDHKVYLFNHLYSRIQAFDTRGNLLRETPIAYHRSRHWKNLILQDEESGDLYTAFHSRWGEYICQLDVETGELKKAVELEIDFTEKVSIRNGVLYFLHRDPYAGIGNKMLKKVRIN